MIDLIELLQVEGTARIQVLVYGLLPLDGPTTVDLTRWIEQPNCWLFEHESWPYQMVLEEIEIETDEFCPTMVLRGMVALHQSSKADPCYCMLDGVYGGSDTLFLDDASSIYAHLTNGQACMAFDQQLRHSMAWKDSVRRLRIWDSKGGA